MVGTSWKGKKQQAGAGPWVSIGWWWVMEWVSFIYIYIYYIEKSAFTPRFMSKNVTMSHHNYIMEIHTIKFHSFIMEMSFFQQRYGAEKDGHHNLVSGLSKFREFAEQHCMLWTCFTVFCNLSQLLWALYLVLFSLQLSFAHMFAACCAQRPISLWQFFWFESCISTSSLWFPGWAVSLIVGGFPPSWSIHFYPVARCSLAGVRPRIMIWRLWMFSEMRDSNRMMVNSKNTHPRNAQWMGYLYLNLVSNKMHFPSHQLDVKLSWMVIIGTLDLQKPHPKYALRWHL